MTQGEATQEEVLGEKSKISFDHLRPTEDNRCKDCGGRVVKEVISYFRGEYGHRIPHCEGCGRTYLLAPDSVPEVGRERFEAAMCVRMTI